MNEIRFYKPRKDFSGAASQVQAVPKTLKYKTKDTNEEKSYVEWMLFWVIAQQAPSNDAEGNSKFHWAKEEKKQITMKLSDTDIGDILLVLSNRKEFIGGERGLYHQNDNGNSAMQFKKYNDGYALQISSQDKDKSLTKAQHLLTAAEGEVLRLFLIGYLNRKYLG